MTAGLDTLREEAAFTFARAATDRGAALRFFQSEGIDLKNQAALDEARRHWAQLPLLLAPELCTIAVRALVAARGRRVDGEQRFPAVLWLGGATNTKGGREFLGTAAQFVKLLQDRSRVVAPKREGWVIEPTTNPKGRRTNEETHAVHALFLDCDGTGSWDRLRIALDSLDYSYIVYQSGGWTAASPKWRVVLPLSTPHDTMTEAGQLAWKMIYNHARVVLGATAGLLSVGFDPATETPCCPWFLTEKRETTDPVRQISARLAGHSLDLVSLALSLPEAPDEEQKTPDDVVRLVSERSLDDAKLSEIIDALAAVTNHVPAGRRELYLALPGALLDRGVQPDDVIAIVEMVSLSYPRRHADKHADNMHNARTTIGKWHSKTHYTRIGTLQAAAPLVAAALDRVLPGIGDQLSETTKQMLDAITPAPPVPPAPTFTVVSSSMLSVATPPAALPQVKRRIRRAGVAKKISPIATTLRGSKKNDFAIAGVVLTCCLDGQPIPRSPLTSEDQVDEMIISAMSVLGRRLPAATRWGEILDFAGQTLGLMGFAQSVSRMAAAERAFYEGQGKRNQANMKKAAKVATWHAERLRVYGDKGR